MNICLRSLNITEPCSLDLNSWVTFQRLGSHFAADMLPLTVTISPYEKGLGTSCLRLDILRDISFILQKRISEKDRGQREDEGTSTTDSITCAPKKRSSGGGEVQFL